MTEKKRSCKALIRIQNPSDSRSLEVNNLGQSPFGKREGYQYGREGLTTDYLGTERDFGITDTLAGGFLIYKSPETRGT